MPAQKKDTPKILKPQKRTSGVSCFWVNNGPVVGSISELKCAFATMSGEQFAHHTGNGNDFAAWLHDVLHHRDCAKRVARARSARGASRVLDSCKD